MNKYRVIEASSESDYDYLLLSPTGEEVNGGLGLHNKMAMEIQADMLNAATAPLLAQIASQEAQLARLRAALGKASDLLATCSIGKSESAAFEAYEVIKQALQTGETPKPYTTDFATEAVEMITGIPTKPKQFVTKHHEAMAVFHIGNAELVAFPKTWQGYKHAIIEAGHRGNTLSFHVSPDNSRGYIQYIVRAIEGVAPKPFEASETGEGNGGE